MTLRLYILQRLTAALMVPLIVAHLVVIFYATSHGLSAADILSRTRGSTAWALFYGSFVVLAAVHGAIGVRSVLADWTTLRGAALDALMWGFGLLLLALGLRAACAVVV
jgi:fumarate reductase subunit C